MVGFEINRATGRYIIVDPAEKSSVLKADEISTVFKIVSVGSAVEINVQSGDLIIVTPNCVEKTVMANTTIYYIRDTDVVGVVGATSN